MTTQEMCETDGPQTSVSPASSQANQGVTASTFARWRDLPVSNCNVVNKKRFLRSRNFVRERPKLQFGTKTA